MIEKYQHFSINVHLIMKRAEKQETKPSAASRRWSCKKSIQAHWSSNVRVFCRRKSFLPFFFWSHFLSNSSQNDLNILSWSFRMDDFDPLLGARYRLYDLQHRRMLHLYFRIWLSPAFLASTRNSIADFVQCLRTMRYIWTRNDVLFLFITIPSDRG